MRRLLLWLAVAGLAAPAVPLTVNRLLDLESGPAVRLMAFTPYATPFYLVLVPLLGVALWRGWGGPRRVVALVAAVPALALGVHLWWLAPLFVGGGPAAADGAPRLTVMNLNMYEGRADTARTLGLALERGVDVLVLQEISFGAQRALEALGVDEAYPHRIGTPNGSIDGTVVYSRLPLGTPTQLETVFQSWLVEVGEGEEALTLLAVHPRAPTPPGGVAQWERENAVVLEAGLAAGADLVVGDFNATADHAPMRAWREAGWRDSLEMVDAGWSRTWPANGITPVPRVSLPALIQIDHVLVGERLAATRSDVVEIAGSDHRAVLATVARR